MFVPRTTVLVLSAVIATAAQVAVAESSNLFAAAMNSITTDEVYEHVSVLADDVYEGRAAGSRGGQAASRYLVKQLEQHGFVPAGDGDGYTQSFAGDWRNLLAMRPGYDPDLEHEVVVVGAHYDHVGYGNRGNSYGPIGRIHNGADDNASGIAVLLETMEAFATSGLRTRRSILFAFWDGEERGLVGSRHWLAHPTLPVAGVSDPAYRVKFAVTVDMVGRLRRGQLYVLGTRSGFGMRRLMCGPLPMTLPAPGKRPARSEEREARNEERGARSESFDESLALGSSALASPLWLDFSWDLHDNSDHWSFLERNVPTVLLHTGLHRDYHRPSDDVEKVNRDGMRDVSRYLLATLTKIANEDQLPRFRSRVTRETDGTRRRLERPLEPASLANWPPNEPTPRLGISWREDAAEPGSVFLTRVVDGTPAAAAGLAVHDRIYELDGEPFADPVGFQLAIAALLDRGEPEFTLLTERRGHTRTVTVKLTPSGQAPGAAGEEPAQPAPDALNP